MRKRRILLEKKGAAGKGRAVAKSMKGCAPRWHAGGARARTNSSPSLFAKAAKSGDDTVSTARSATMPVSSIMRGVAMRAAAGAMRVKPGANAVTRTELRADCIVAAEDLGRCGGLASGSRGAHF